MFYLTLQPATLNLDNISWVCTDNRTLAFVVHKICHNFCSHQRDLGVFFITNERDLIGTSTDSIFKSLPLSFPSFTCANEA